MGDRRLPEALKVTCFLADAPLPGGWITISLAPTRKNPFHWLFGPADETGRIKVTRADLLREGEKDVRLFPMDYGDPERDWSGRLVIAPLNRSDIERALGAYEEWGLAGVEYPPDYATGLEALAERLSRNAGETLSVDVEIRPVGSAETIVREKAA